jgi:hypothetical protein
VIFGIGVLALYNSKNSKDSNSLRVGACYKSERRQSLLKITKVGEYGIYFKEIHRLDSEPSFIYMTRQSWKASTEQIDCDIYDSAIVAPEVFNLLDLSH